MATSAQITLFGPDDNKVHVYEVEFPQGDNGYNTWMSFPVPQAARVADGSKGNCWVHYASEDGHFLTATFLFTHSGTAVGWFKSVQDIGYGEGYGKRGRAPMLYMERKTWKESQGKAPQRRIYPPETPVHLGPSAPTEPTTKPTGPKPLPEDTE